MEYESDERRKMNVSEMKCFEKIRRSVTNG